MRNDTRKLFTGYLSQVAKLNGVESANATFNVDPSIQQKLETKIQESSEFLGKINIIGVDEQEGEKVGLGVGSTIAGRTNTNVKAREPRSIGTLSSTFASSAKGSARTSITCTGNTRSNTHDPSDIGVDKRSAP